MDRSHEIKVQFKKQEDWAYALNVIETVAWLAGRPDYFDELGQAVAEFKLFEPTTRVRSARVFEWLAAAMSYQGISDAVARTFMTKHCRPRWRSIAHGVRTASCPLLQSYWHFHGCHYRKATHACAMQPLIDTCALPSHDFRNGNLNQLTYSLFLFIRDIADGDLVGWIDARLAEAADRRADHLIQAMADALIAPLSGVHGASAKVLNMVLADLLIVGGAHNPAWAEVAGSLIAIDTLVHNFLMRTGILKRAHAKHAYGPQCYGPRGCARILAALSQSIDARQFNSAFPKYFPRYIQHAIWAYCAEDGQGICNGRKIDDAKRCRNWDCRLFTTCDRRALRPKCAI